MALDISSLSWRESSSPSSIHSKAECCIFTPALLCTCKKRKKYLNPNWSCIIVYHRRDSGWFNWLSKKNTIKKMSVILTFFIFCYFSLFQLFGILFMTYYKRSNGNEKLSTVVYSWRMWTNHETNIFYSVSAAMQCKYKVDVPVNNIQKWIEQIFYSLLCFPMKNKHHIYHTLLLFTIFIKFFSPNVVLWHTWNITHQH